ncbi:ABC transporter ATP-binding protein [Nesterenkonia ebinurensis]|uniref:ABC transporter ATP-binding protein n=1 Tax=Nesterenkonia ebinurensis TaxID=2608252 RepID=UPI00123D8180|nr:ATP-binding cassette domain-containing protein [Nesterenkonia ebinurensis]
MRGLLKRRKHSADILGAEVQRPVPTGPPAVELEGVTIRYTEADGNERVIVQDFSLTIPQGAVHCLAGRSGSGKTSLLRVATATQTPTSGEVRWAESAIVGLNHKQLAAARRQHMGYVDQGATVIEELTVLDNVLIPAMPEGITAEITQRANELLERFGLAAATRQKARSLSGGERQRLAIVRGLLLEPTALALDEPTASLDRNTANTVIEAMHTAASSGAAVLVASHDPEVIASAHTVTRLV